MFSFWAGTKYIDLEDYGIKENGRYILTLHMKRIDN
jgi:hypothetical protein